MEYYNQNIEDAKIVKNLKADGDTNSVYSQEMIDRIESIRNKAKFTNLMENNKFSVKTGITFALIGIGYALYSRRNVVLLGGLGAMSGLALGNIFNKFFTLTKKDYSNDSESSL